MSIEARKFRAKGIILARTDFGEADRIITFLTPNHGKVKAMAKGVRKSKSKLAGGIELFSVSDLSFIIGKRDIDTLVSTRLVKHYGNIVKDLDRTNLAYELIKRLHKATEDQPEPAYFDLLNGALAALDDDSIDPALTELWFNLHLLKIAGHAINLRTDAAGKELAQSRTYSFNADKMCFSPDGRGSFGADHIKFLRIGASHGSPAVLSRINGSRDLVLAAQPVIKSIMLEHIRV